MTYIKICILAMAAWYCSLGGGEALDNKNVALLAEILEMKDLDQASRAECVDAAFDKEICRKVAEVDQQHLKRLKSIIQEYGWPGFQLVGPEGSEAFWLLVQHVSELDFQKQCLEFLPIAVNEKDASPINLAYLQDRILMNAGKPQIYGTQWMRLEGKHLLYPVEDRLGLNERRLAMGLNTIEESRLLYMEAYRLSEEEVFLDIP